MTPESMSADEIQWALNWVLGLATPPRPDPSAWTETAWLDHWREQRHRVLLVLEEALKQAVDR